MNIFRNHLWFIFLLFLLSLQVLDTLLIRPPRHSL